MRKADPWIQGYCCAVATFIRSHNASTEVVDLIRALGKTEAQLRNAKVDKLDLQVLLLVIRTERLKAEANRKFKRYGKILWVTPEDV